MSDSPQCGEMSAKLTEGTCSRWENTFFKRGFLNNAYKLPYRYNSKRQGIFCAENIYFYEKICYNILSAVFPLRTAVSIHLKGTIDMGNILEVKELSKQYSKVLAADKVSFTVGEGEIFALIGPNGAGKTTTIRMISTLLTPTDGDAVIAGYSITKEPKKVRECITYLPDEAGAYKTMTGIGYLRFMAGLFTTDIDKINEYVERAKSINGLGERLNDKIGTYSRGMIRKLLLSRAVMNKPKLAILDEPTSGLDVLNAIEIRKMIKKLAAEENMSFLLSSHNMLEIEFVSDRVGIISKGHLLVTGSSAELKERYNASNLEEVFERVVNDNEIR